jgi:hypothetical protein
MWHPAGTAIPVLGGNGYVGGSPYNLDAASTATPGGPSRFASVAGRLRLVLDSDEAPSEWAYVRCPCRLTYRYADMPTGLAFWPQNSPASFGALPVDGEECIVCGEPLAPLVERRLRRIPL